MSYNIDTFEVKKLENLIIPLEAFYMSFGENFHLCVRFYSNLSVNLTDCEGEGVTGKLTISEKKLMATVTDLDISGEGSGRFMREILEPALKKSTGFLTASCVWECGDSINKLIVENGNVRWENIEI